MFPGMETFNTVRKKMVIKNGDSYHCPQGGTDNYQYKLVTSIRVLKDTDNCYLILRKTEKCHQI